MVQLELDVRQWQEVHQCHRLPTLDEDTVLSRRISEYCENDKSIRCRSMRAAFPSDVESIKELKLDCLESSDDSEGGIKWRSDMERSLMQAIPGWCEGSVLKAAFVPLSTMLFGVGVGSRQGLDEVVSGDVRGSCGEVAKEEDVDMEVDAGIARNDVSAHLQLAKNAFAVLENVTMKFEMKLREVAMMLDCTPTIAGIGESLARLVLSSYEDDDVERPLQRFQCRLCDFGCPGKKDFLQHLVEKHGGGMDDGRVLIEYRKKVIGLLTHLGPSVSCPRWVGQCSLYR